MKVFVLTKEYNQYDQYGAYFVAVFKEKPHHSWLTALGVPTNRLKHVQNGGGRVKYEEEWYILEEVKCLSGVTNVTSLDTAEFML